MSKSHEILLVDDSEVDVRLMELALLEAKVQHNLHIVNNGPDAIAFLHQHEPYTDAARPDLILLDVNMPQMSGHEVLDEIKADDELKSIPVVVLTTSNDPQLVRTSYRKYANSHISKPLDFDELVTKVAEGINQYWFNVVDLPPA